MSLQQIPIIVKARLIMLSYSLNFLIIMSENVMRANSDLSTAYIRLFIMLCRCMHLTPSHTK